MKLDIVAVVEVNMVAVVEVDKVTDKVADMVVGQTKLTSMEIQFGQGLIGLRDADLLQNR